MRIITRKSDPAIRSLRKSVFLAGPCDSEHDWRAEAVKTLESLGFDGDIIDPTNNGFTDVDVQIAWEHDAMCYANCIVFWIPRSDKHPGMVTNIEFGEWHDKEGVFCGFPIGSPGNESVEARLKMCGKHAYHDLESLLKDVVQFLNRKGRIFFTSDTHFSQQRRMKLSRRPFKTTKDMDNTIISNWNKLVMPGDSVVHLGDFGNPEILPLLSFGKLYFVPGNYETDNPSDKGPSATLDDMRADGRVTILKNGQSVRLKDGAVARLAHKPSFMKNDPKAFWLFGHIHRCQAMRRNGMNVGVDVNNFTPFTMEDVMFFYEDILYYCDEECF